MLRRGLYHSYYSFCYNLGIRNAIPVCLLFYSISNRSPLLTIKICISQPPMQTCHSTAVNGRIVQHFRSGSIWWREGLRGSSNVPESKQAAVATCQCESGGSSAPSLFIDWWMLTSTCALPPACLPHSIIHSLSCLFAESQSEWT